MKTETLPYIDEKTWLKNRTVDITSTEMAALFGCSPYLTEFELWHMKRSGEIPEFKANSRMKWGTRLQDSIAAGIAEEQGWRLRRMDEYSRLPELNVGASFDFSIEEGIESETKEGEAYVEKGLLEIKNVDGLQYKQGWITDEGDIQAPAHIELQVQVQLFVSGRACAFIGALVGGNDLILVERKPIKAVQDAIVTKAESFWRSIRDNKPPEPNYKTDAEFIARLYNYTNPGSVIDVTGQDEYEKMLEEYNMAAEDEKDGRERKAAIKAQILVKFKDVEKLIFSGGTVSMGVVKPFEVKAFTNPGYRMFKPNWKKG